MGELDFTVVPVVELSRSLLLLSLLQEMLL